MIFVFRKLKAVLMAFVLCLTSIVVIDNQSINVSGSEKINHCLLFSFLFFFKMRFNYNCSPIVSSPFFFNLVKNKFF